LFDGGREPDEIRGESIKDKEKRLKEEEKENKNLQKWNWFVFIYSLCRGDITKRSDILKMNFISVMNWKSFEHENPNIKNRYDKNGDS
jgi:hypothetical protein